MIHFWSSYVGDCGHGQLTPVSGRKQEAGNLSARSEALEQALLESADDPAEALDAGTAEASGTPAVCCSALPSAEDTLQAISRHRL